MKGDRNMKSKNVIACITAQEACLNIINAAKKMAEKLGSGVKIVTVQPKTVDANTRAADLKCLYTLANASSCNIDIIYSEDITSALSSYISKQSACHIYIGTPDISSTFFKQFMKCEYNVPISVVNSKIIYTLPPCEISLLELNQSIE